MSLFRLGRPRSSESSAVKLPASVAAGQRVYAFGDVHGRADLLRPLFRAIERDAARSAATHSIVVGLGDYIDRGMEAKAVVQTLLDGIPGCELVALRGNHEQMLLDFLERPQRSGPGWVTNGALETLYSYGVDIRGSTPFDGAGLQALRDSLARNIPPAHLLALTRMPLSFISEDYFFVHAGVRHGIGVEDQSARDLLWTRSGEGDEPFDKVVVHGHTPVDQPYLGRYRINLDTGAYFTSRLSCLVLEGTTFRLLDV